MPSPRSITPAASVGPALCFLASAALGLATPGGAAAADLAEELKTVPYRIVYESHRDKNWELYQINADGSHPVNLTRTPKTNELYPHVSPDGTKVSFCVDEGQGAAKVRDVYVMNIDGTGRTLVARNAREPCWSPSGSGLVCLHGEFEKFTLQDFATRGIFTCGLAGGSPAEHPNPAINHLYNICCTPDGKWFVATVHAGMGFSHAILAIQADGQKVVNLKISGCRPDLSADGKKIAWGADDFTLRVGDLAFTGPEPKVVNQRNAVKSKEPIETYHVDWSPDGKYLAFSRGPKKKSLGPAPEMIGVQADGWDICVADAAATNRVVVLTTDGQSNKEPDWAPIPKDKR